MPTPEVKQHINGRQPEATVMEPPTDKPIQPVSILEEGKQQEGLGLASAVNELNGQPGAADITGLNGGSRVQPGATLLSEYDAKYGTSTDPEIAGKAALNAQEEQARQAELAAKEQEIGLKKDAANAEMEIATQQTQEQIANVQAKAEAEIETEKAKAQAEIERMQQLATAQAEAKRIESGAEAKAIQIKAAAAANAEMEMANAKAQATGITNQAEKEALLSGAQAKAAAIRTQSAAEADAILAKGQAEADALRAKAAAAGGGSGPGPIQTRAPANQPSNGSGGSGPKMLQAAPSGSRPINNASQPQRPQSPRPMTTMEGPTAQAPTLTLGPNKPESPSTNPLSPEKPQPTGPERRSMPNTGGLEAIKSELNGTITTLQGIAEDRHDIMDQRELGVEIETVDGEIEQLSINEAREQFNAERDQIMDLRESIAGQREEDLLQRESTNEFFAEFIQTREELFNEQLDIVDQRHELEPLFNQTVNEQDQLALERQTAMDTDLQEREQLAQHRNGIFDRMVEIGEELQALQEEYERNEAEIASLEAQLTGTEADAFISARIAELEARNQEIIEEKEVLNGELDEKRSVGGAMRSDFEGLYKTTEACKSQESALATAMNDLIGQEEELNTQSAELSQQANQTQTDQYLQAHDLLDQEEELNQQTADRDQAEQLLNQRSESITQQRAQIDDYEKNLDNQVAGLNATSEYIETQLNQLKTRLETIQTELQNTLTQPAGPGGEQQVEEAKAKQEAMQAEAEQIKQRLQELTEGQQTTNESFKRIEDERNGIREDREALKEERQDHESQRFALEGERTALAQQQVDVLIQRRQTLQASEAAFIEKQAFDERAIAGRETITNGRYDNLWDEDDIEARYALLDALRDADSGACGVLGAAGDLEDAGVRAQFVSEYKAAAREYLQFLNQWNEMERTEALMRAEERRLNGEAILLTGEEEILLRKQLELLEAEKVAQGDAELAVEEERGINERTSTLDESEPNLNEQEAALDQEVVALDEEEAELNTQISESLDDGDDGSGGNNNGNDRKNQKKNKPETKQPSREPNNNGKVNQAEFESNWRNLWGLWKNPNHQTHLQNGNLANQARQHRGEIESWGNRALNQQLNEVLGPKPDSSGVIYPPTGQGTRRHKK